jgi:hypothetical protein
MANLRSPPGARKPPGRLAAPTDYDASTVRGEEGYTARANPVPSSGLLDHTRPVPNRIPAIGLHLAALALYEAQPTNLQEAQAAPAPWQREHYQKAKRLHPNGLQSRSLKSAQDAKWSFCLTRGTLCPRIRRDHEQKTACGYNAGAHHRASRHFQGEENETKRVLYASNRVFGSGLYCRSRK